MLTARICAALAFATFAAFFGILLYKVQRPDLAVAVLLGLGLTGYDVWRQVGPRRRG
jgi:hypothetical protein